MDDEAAERCTVASQCWKRHITDGGRRPRLVAEPADEQIRRWAVRAGVEPWPVEEMLSPLVCPPLVERLGTSSGSINQRREGADAAAAAAASAWAWHAHGQRGAGEVRGGRRLSAN